MVECLMFLYHWETFISVLLPSFFISISESIVFDIDIEYKTATR